MQQYDNDRYPLQEETYKIIGIGMEIHKTPGNGFSLIVYKDVYVYELKQNDLFYEREKSVD